MSQQPVWTERPEQGVVEVELVVEGWARGMRLDQYLCRRFGKLSRSRARLIVEKTLTVNGTRPRKPGQRVRPGDRIVIRRPIKPEPPAPRHVPVLADFGGFLAVDKPAGLPVHPAGQYYEHTVTTILRRSLDPGVVIAHRLDRETSGVLLVCVDKAVERALKAQFRERKVHKEYLAIVRGQLAEPGEVAVGLSLRRDSPIAVKMYPDEHGDPAVTWYEPVALWSDFTMLKLVPKTGRQHQLRAHMEYLGHPIVGDKMYGVPPDIWFRFIRGGMTEELRSELLVDRQALHAWRSTLKHPVTGRRVEAISPLASDMWAFVEGLGNPDWSGALWERLRDESRWGRGGSDRNATTQDWDASEKVEVPR